VRLKQMLRALDRKATAFANDPRIARNSLLWGVIEGRRAMRLLKRHSRAARIEAYWVASRACLFYWESGLFDV
jgi:hypothetical protein